MYWEEPKEYPTLVLEERESAKASQETGMNNKTEDKEKEEG